MRGEIPFFIHKGRLAELSPALAPQQQKANNKGEVKQLRPKNISEFRPDVLDFINSKHHNKRD